jgi:hypothetical protein
MQTDELDPVEEIRAIREKIARKYDTTEAYFEHVKTIPTAEGLLEHVRRKKNRKTTPVGSL